MATLELTNLEKKIKITYYNNSIKYKKIYSENQILTIDDDSIVTIRIYDGVNNKVVYIIKKIFLGIFYLLIDFFGFTDSMEYFYHSDNSFKIKTNMSIDFKYDIGSRGRIMSIPKELNKYKNYGFLIDCLFGAVSFVIIFVIIIALILMANA